MKSPDEDIDRILTGLREIQPSAQFEDGMLRVLRERTEPRSSVAGRWPSTLAKRALRVALHRTPMSLTGLVLVALLIFLAKGKFHPAPRPTPLTAAAISPQPTIVRTPATPRHTVGRLLAVPRAGRIRIPKRGDAISAEELLAKEEMQAPSLVAPALPASAQERALSHIGQRHRPDALAGLDSDLRARQQAQATTDFYHFFEPSRESKSNN